MNLVKYQNPLLIFLEKKNFYYLLEEKKDNDSEKNLIEKDKKSDKSDILKKIGFISLKNLI